VIVVGLAVTLLVAWLVGWLVVSAGWPGPGPSRAAGVMRVALALGLGLGLSSAAFSAAIDLGRPSWTAAALADLVLLAVALWLWARRQPRMPARELTRVGRWEWIDRVLVAGVLLTMVPALTMATVRTIAYPHGDWDAWAIWNAKARYMVRAGEAWRAGLLPPNAGTDYPLLVPGAVAREWIYLKQETRLAPAVIAGLFTAATVVLASAVVSLRRGRRLGLLAAILLLGSPSVIVYGTSQCADMPVGFYLLAAVALLTTADAAGQMPRRGALLLAGLSLGLGAWSKNEGIYYLVVVVLAHSIVRASGRGLRAAIFEAATLGAGAAPVLAILAHHRAVQPLGWTLTHVTRQGAFLNRVLDPERYRLIGAYFLQFGADLGGWAVSVLPLLVLCALAWGLRVEPGNRVSAGRAALVLGLAVAGLFGVYLTASNDLDWQMPTSLPRLYIQLWPSAVLLFALVVRSPVVPGDARLPSSAAPAAA